MIHTEEDYQAVYNALKKLVKFVDNPNIPPVLTLTNKQIKECENLFKECYKCLWSEHPGEKEN